MDIKPYSEKEAVNQILGTIGQAPVNSLTENLTLDAANAVTELNQAVREIQMEGYNFNLEEDYPFPRNSDEEIVLPPNVFTVDINRSSHLHDFDPVIRAGKLYDRKNHTYKFTRDLIGQVIFILPFDQLPEAAKFYAFRKAGRNFQSKVMGSRILHAITSEMLGEAKRIFKRAHQQVKDHNILDNRGDYRPGSVFNR